MAGPIPIKLLDLVSLSTLAIGQHKSNSKLRPLMMTLYGFTDASGDVKQDDRLFICGYVGSDESWHRFSSCWAHELRMAGVSAIHATELLSRRGIFTGWSQTKANDLIARCIDVIRSMVPIGLACGIDVKHYRSLAQGHRNKIGQPLLILMSRLVDTAAGVVREMQQRGDQIEGINLTFDDSEADAEKMLGAWISLKGAHHDIGKLIPSVGFADNKFFYPLQAADLLANLTNRYWQRRPGRATAAESAERHLRTLLTPPDAEHRFAYRVGFVTAAEMDEAVRLHRRLY